MESGGGEVVAAAAAAAADATAAAAAAAACSGSRSRHHCTNYQPETDTENICSTCIQFSSFLSNSNPLYFHTS